MAEKRRFKRYFRNSHIDLKFNKQSFKAETVDYSPEGIGAKVEGELRIGKGDVVSFSMEQPEIKTFGEVVWSKRDKSGLRFGLRNIGRIKGLIKDFSPADILIGLQRSGKTGILTIESGSIVKKVFVKDGDMVFSSSNQDEDRLGDLLLREEIITREQYDQSVKEMKRSGQRQGAALVSLGYLKSRGLAVVVRYQVENIILSLFSLTDGRFSFEERPLPAEEVITLKLSAANLIYNGIKKFADIRRFESELPSMDDIPCFSSDPLNLFQDINLDYHGKKIISCIDGKTPVRDIASITQLDYVGVLKTLYALLSTHLIEIKDRDEPSVEVPEEVIDEVREEIREGKAEEDKEQEVDSYVREMIEGTHRRCETLGHYEVLGVKDYATISEIKSAYYKVAKKFHPDMHYYLTDASLKSKLSDIFACIYEAYATLSNPQKRKEYDMLMTHKPARLLSNQDKAKAKFEEGKIELKKGNLPDAELLFGQATYFDSTIADYHYFYGLALAGQNKFHQAEKAFDKALKLEPQNPDYLAELGFVFFDLGFQRRARGFFEKALRVAPDNARAAEGMRKFDPH